jgi:hypothetical protein
MASPSLAFGFAFSWFFLFIPCHRRKPKPETNQKKLKRI